MRFFDDFSAHIGSLKHAPVPGKPVGLPSCGSLLHRSDPVASKVSEEAIFQEECRQDLEFRNRVRGLERLLRVKAQKESSLMPGGALPGKLAASHAEKTLPRSMKENASETNIRWYGRRLCAPSSSLFL